MEDNKPITASDNELRFSRKETLFLTFLLLP